MVAALLRRRKPDTCSVAVEERDLLFFEADGGQDDFSGGLQLFHECGLIQAETLRLVPMPDDGGGLSARQIAPVLRRVVLLPVDDRLAQRVLRQDATAGVCRRIFALFERNGEDILLCVAELDRIRDIVLEERALCSGPSNILSIQHDIERRGGASRHIEPLGAVGPVILQYRRKVEIAGKHLLAVGTLPDVVLPFAEFRKVVRPHRLLGRRGRYHVFDYVLGIDDGLCRVAPEIAAREKRPAYRVVQRLRLERTLSVVVALEAGRMNVEYVRHRVDGDGIVGGIVVARALVSAHVHTEKRGGRELARMFKFLARGSGGVRLHVEHPVPVHLRRFALLLRAHRGALVADVADDRQIGLPAGLCI